MLLSSAFEASLEAVAVIFKARQESPLKLSESGSTIGSKCDRNLCGVEGAIFY